MKTKEELENIKEQFDAVNKKFSELADDELEEVTGGFSFSYVCTSCGKKIQPVGNGIIGFVITCECGGMMIPQV